MKRDWLEHKLQEKLSGHIQSDIDLDTVWQDIEEIRYPRKKRRYFFYLIWLMAGVALLGLLLNSKISQLPVENPSEKASIQNVVLNEQQVNRNDNSNNLIIDNSDKIKSDQNIVQLHNEKLTKSQSIAKPKVSQSKINPNGSSNVSNSKTSKSITSKSITSESITSERINTETLNNSINRTYPTKINSPRQNKIDPNKKSRSSQNFSFVTPDSEKTLGLNNNLNGSSVEKSQFSQADIGRSFIHVESLESTAMSFDFLTNETMLLKPIADFHQSLYNDRPTLELGIAYSYGRSTGSIAGNEDKIILREDESHVDAQQVHVKLRKLISRNFSIQTGILLSQHVKLFQSEYNKVRTEERENLILEIISRNDGSTELVRGVGSAIITESGEIRNYQRYRTLSIPLQIGYQMTLNDHISLQLDGGIHLGYSLQNRGRSFYNSDSNSYVNINDLGYKNKFYMGHMYALGFKTKISKSINFDIGINSNWDLTDRNSELDVTDKFNRYGIYLGITKVLAQ